MILARYIWILSVLIWLPSCSKTKSSGSLSSYNSNYQSISFRAASFNVDYKNKDYSSVAHLINSVRDSGKPFVIGTQENHSNGEIARRAGLTRTSLGQGNLGDNSILTSGQMTVTNSSKVNIERDTYAQRTLVWTRIKLQNGSMITVFNTHLPHGAVSNVRGNNKPASRDSHRNTAQLVLGKWREMGEPPAVIVCDCNTGKVGGQQFKSAIASTKKFQTAVDGGLDLIFFTSDSLDKVHSDKGGSLTESFHRIIWSEFRLKNSGGLNNEPPNLGTSNQNVCRDQNKLDHLASITTQQILGMKNDSKINTNAEWMACIKQFEKNSGGGHSHQPSTVVCRDQNKLNHLASITTQQILGMKNDSKINTNVAWMACIKQFEANGGGGHSQPSMAVCKDQNKLNHLASITSQQIQGMKNDSNIYTNAEWMTCIKQFEANGGGGHSQPSMAVCKDQNKLNYLASITSQQIQGMKNDSNIYTNAEWMTCIRQFEQRGY